MTRLAPVPPGSGGPVARLGLWLGGRRLGQVPASFGVTAHHPQVFTGYAAFEWYVDRADTVDARLKDLAALKVASVIGCAWCLDLGSALARGGGASERQILELSHHRESDAFDEVQRLVLDYAEAMTRTPPEVDDDLFAALRERFDERQMVELTALIALENYRSRFNDAVGIEPQGFSSAACALPERRGEDAARGAGRADGPQRAESTARAAASPERTAPSM